MDKYIAKLIIITTTLIGCIFFISAKVKIEENNRNLIYQFALDELAIRQNLFLWSIDEIKTISKMIKYNEEVENFVEKWKSENFYFASIANFRAISLEKNIKLSKADIDIIISDFSKSEMYKSTYIRTVDSLEVEKERQRALNIKTILKEVKFNNNSITLAIEDVQLPDQYLKNVYSYIQINGKNYIFNCQPLYLKLPEGEVKYKLIKNTKFQKRVN